MKQVEFIDWISGTASQTGTRPKMEDTDVSNIPIKPDGTKQMGVLYGVWDGHGGDLVSKFAEDNYPKLFESHLPTNGSPTDFQVVKAFKEADRDFQMNCPKTGGTTTLVAYILGKKIFVNCLGDCRLIIFNRKTGEICRNDFRVYDNSLDTVRDVKNSLTMTKIHAMPGLARLPDGKLACSVKLSQMDKCTIDNDDDEQSAKREWIAYNISLNPSADPDTVEAILPWHLRGDPSHAFRLSPCGTQPTRGTGNENTIHLGEVYVFDCQDIDLDKHAITMSCDGIEDNGCLTAHQIPLACCENGYHFWEKQLVIDNFLLNNCYDKSENSKFIPEKWNEPTNDMNLSKQLEIFCQSTEYVNPFEKKYRVKMFNNDRFWRKAVNSAAANNLDDIRSNISQAYLMNTPEEIKRVVEFTARMLDLRACADNKTLKMIFPRKN